MPGTLRSLAAKFFSLAEREAEVLDTLHHEVQATLQRLGEADPGLPELLEKSHAYAVFPAVGKASALVGAAFGTGEVFKRGDLIGYAAVAQLTLGVQLGGQTFVEVIALESKEALDRFKRGRWALAANASAVLVKAGAAATADYESGAAVFVYSEGGMMLEAAVGAQKFIFKPAVLGRATETEKPTEAAGGKRAKGGRAGGARGSGKAKPQTKAKPQAKTKARSARSGAAKRSGANKKKSARARR